MLLQRKKKNIFLFLIYLFIEKKLSDFLRIIFVSQFSENWFFRSFQILQDKLSIMNHLHVIIISQKIVRNFHSISTIKN